MNDKGDPDILLQFDFEGKEYVFKKQYLPDKTKPIQIPDHLYIIQRYMTLSTDREMEGAKYQHKTIVNMICEELMTVCGWIKIVTKTWKVIKELVLK